MILAYSLRCSQRTLYLPHRSASGLLCLIWHPISVKSTFLVGENIGSDSQKGLNISAKAFRAVSNRS